MRRLILAAVVMAPIAANAQTTAVSIPAPMVEHALAYLHNGGTRAEGDALAEQMLAAAQADVAKQQAATKKPDTPAGK